MIGMLIRAVLAWVVSLSASSSLGLELRVSVIELIVGLSYEL
jgi:hypothetical protein